LSTTKESRVGQPWPWWRWSLLALNLLALSLSVYLGWHYVVGGSVIGCGGGSPCDRVLNSRWSSLGGVLPVSVLAVGVYLAMLVAGFFIGPSAEPSLRKWAWGAVLILAGAAAGSAVWFISVQKWAIGSFCPYCMATHTTGLFIAALAIWQAPRQSVAGATEVPRPKSAASPAASGKLIGLPPAIGLASVGLGLAALMAMGQVHFTPPSAYRSGETAQYHPVMDPHTSPLIGSPDAPQIISVLFDYKCPHCQQLHFMLNEVVRRYHGQLAFVLCPTPLNTQCNPYIPRDVDEFKGSCELARVALAVWVARREAFPVFDTWMYSLDSGDVWQPRSLEAAKAKAVALVGQARFEAAQADPWIDHYLQASIRIYGTTLQGGNNAVPKMVFGPRWVIPQPNSVDDLIAILQARLAVSEP